MNCVTVVTWNKPLYNPKPDPIAWMSPCERLAMKPLKDKAALKSKIIAVIRVNNVGEIVEEFRGIAINNVISPINSIKS